MQAPRLRANAGFSPFSKKWNEAFKLTFFTLRFLRSLREIGNLVNSVNPVNNISRPCVLCLARAIHTVTPEANNSLTYVV